MKIKFDLSLDQILSAPFGPVALEVERGLQIASGAMFISLLTLLGNVWGSPNEAKFALQVATITPLWFSGGAFLMAMNLTLGRLIGGITLVGSILWYVICAIVLGCLISSGSIFVHGVARATVYSVDTGQWQLRDLDARLENVRTKLEMLENKIDTLLNDGKEQR